MNQYGAVYVVSVNVSKTRSCSHYTYTLNFGGEYTGIRGGNFYDLIYEENRHPFLVIEEDQGFVFSVNGLPLFSLYLFMSVGKANNRRLLSAFDNYDFVIVMTGKGICDILDDNGRVVGKIQNASFGKRMVAVYDCDQSSIVMMIATWVMTKDLRNSHPRKTSKNRIRIFVDNSICGYLPDDGR